MQNFEKKARKIKKAIKNLVVENSALCDQISSVQNNIDIVKQEREFLLRKLIEHEPAIVSQQPIVEPRIYKKSRKNSSSVDLASDTSSINKPLAKKVKVQTSLLKKQVPALPKLPVTIDGGVNGERITLHSLGVFNERHNYPVGYKISRIHNNTMFICRIIDNGQLPLFIISDAADPSNSFSGSTSDDCHAEFLTSYENFNMPYELDGDNFFGLTNKKIKDFVNLLPRKQIKQEIKQENLTFFDDNARNFTM